MQILFFIFFFANHFIFCKLARPTRGIVPVVGGPFKKKKLKIIFWRIIKDLCHEW